MCLVSLRPSSSCLGVPYAPLPASVDGIMCAPMVCICEQRFQSHIKPLIFLERGSPGSALPSALMNSSRGIPGVQNTTGAPLPTFILLWKMYARGGREQSGRHSPPCLAHSSVELHVGDAPHAMGNQWLPAQGASPAARKASMELFLVV